MDKQQLLEKKKELTLSLRKVCDELSNYDKLALRNKYGDKLNCSYCRYSVVFGLSYDGWHNLCGAETCTCCHNFCEKYKPDNVATAYIKDLLKCDSALRSSQISSEEADALEELGAQIFGDNVSDYTMQLLKLFIEHKSSKS